MKAQKETYSHRKFSINCRGKLFELASPKIMGILNITPDSFSDGGLFLDQKNALQAVENLVTEGADLIDIGAQSTRPQAQKITAEEEILRLKSILPAIRSEHPNLILSLDTFYSKVVQFGYDEGIDIVNDISGGFFDENLLRTVSTSKLPYILMHNQPTYELMHQTGITEDIIYNINRYFSFKIKELSEMGIDDVILDPGFGFGKTIEQQLEMIEEFQNFGFGKFPILAGISRKSFIYKTYNKTPLDIIEETKNLHKKLLQNGATILRVHDVGITQMLLTEMGY